MTPTKDEVLRQINRIAIFQQKLTSNMKEAVGEQYVIVEKLFPFRDSEGNSLLIDLGMRIVDNPEHQTFINVQNFYFMTHRDDALRVSYPMMHDGEEIYELDMRTIMSLFGI